jgi:hypothetical protein
VIVTLGLPCPAMVAVPAATDPPVGFASSRNELVASKARVVQGLGMEGHFGAIIDYFPEIFSNL